MNTSQSVENIQKAIIQAAPQLVTIKKNKQGYNYKYATLDAVIDMLRSVLPAHGLWFAQLLTGKNSLITRVFHESGEWIESEVEMLSVDLAGRNISDAQKQGAAITYFKRYALTSFFGIAADEDVDGVVKQDPQQKTQAPSATRARKFVNDNIQQRLKIGESEVDILSSYSQLMNFEVTNVNKLDDYNIVALATAIYNQQHLTANGQQQ